MSRRKALHSLVVISAAVSMTGLCPFPPPRRNRGDRLMSETSITSTMDESIPFLDRNRVAILATATFASG